jgi:hypothetical protein
LKHEERRGERRKWRGRVVRDVTLYVMKQKNLTAVKVPWQCSLVLL